MKTSNHTVLITGGASGIGLALTEQFVRNGNKVIIIGRSESKLNEVKTRYPEITAYACDLQSEDEVDLLVRRVNDEHPSLSVLVNNAGVQYNYSFMEIDKTGTFDRIEEEISLNLAVPIRLTAKLLPLLARHEQAAVVNVSSGLGLVPKKSAPVYCATKAGLHLFTKALRYQLETTNIRVFEIIPPIVDTDMTRGRGRGKITPQQLAAEFWTSYRRDRLEVAIGKVKLLKLLTRIAPAAADALLKNG
ncbi:SDR family oxidoreductase [Paenibacillus contaminans]|uniref:Oxidoreductase n=1 Tax=Paenibacillus contaminans TaxID=450362 RepID=A0A329LNS4_9BACL|nr:SDR family oxidoreductase [Paenibacillus contaminans]RAV08880.1 oxidoreductase [Paenibacillus contaminans]